MNLKFWKQTAEIYTSPINQLFNRLAGGMTKVNLNDCLTGDEKETLNHLKNYRLLTTIEENFQVEVVFGFRGDWIKHFSKSMYGTEANDDNEISEMVFGGVTEHISEIISLSMESIGFELRVNPFNQVQDDKSDFMLNQQSYYIATWDILPGGDAGNSKQAGKEESENLEMIMAVSVPNEKVLSRFSDLSHEKEGLFGTEFSTMVTRIVEEMRIGDSEAHGPTVRRDNRSGAVVDFEPFEKSKNVKNNKEIRNIDILRDVEMNVSVELGKKQISLGKILQLMKGSVVELDKLAGEPVDILVNGHSIAVGDVVVIDEHFGVRISKLLAGHDNMKKTI